MILRTILVALALHAGSQSASFASDTASLPSSRGAATRAATLAGDSLKLEDALAMARSANPMLQVARLRADAAAARVSRAGALPDLQLSLGLMNRRVGDLGGTEDPMTKNSLQLMQALPWPGKLGFAEDRAEHLAQAEHWNAVEAEYRLTARVKSAYYRLAYMDRALDTMAQTRELLRDFLQVSSAIYSVGSGQQQDVLQAQVAVAQMTEDITVMQQSRIAMSARLNALLGREPTAAIGVLEAPAAAGELPSVEGMMELAVEHRPMLRAARERVLAAESGYRSARRTNYPDFTVMLEYGQRPEFNDLASLMVGVSIPVWSGSRALDDEMQAMQLVERANELDLYNETYAALAELRAEAERARNLADLYSTSILPQARAAVESALSAYRVGRVDYMTLLANEMTVNRYQIESLRLAAEFQSAVAQLEVIVGGQLEGLL
ncbi:MAG: TolC family protein [Acidobacteriota bacterium]|nr:MAG: TolC family protein [Acidobacteriota bacterium]